MNARYIVSVLLPRRAVGAVERLQRLRFELGGRIPWSAGYGAYKRHFVTRALEDPELLQRFRRGSTLPAGYGIGLDARCVEYPWLFAHLDEGAELVLDAGSALNHEYLLRRPLLRRKTLHILTLAPEDVCFWQERISYLFSDLRDIPVRNAFYDTVVCVSTLEHVGFDNTFYTRDDAHVEDDPEAFTHAVAELRRVLKPGGTLLLTVPFGMARRYRRLQVFDAGMLQRAVEVLGPARDLGVDFYRYTERGWDVGTQEQCAGAEFVERFSGSASPRSDAFRIEPDRAVGARAVACMRARVE